MYTKQELSRQRQAFWTAFGQYMQPLPSADGEKVHWINYKTGVPGLYFRMDADTTHASVAVVISPADDDMRQLHYQRFQRLRQVLQNTVGELWQWQPEAADEYGKLTARISTTLPGVNICRNEDWPRIISFFKPRIMALDEFWSMVKDGYGQL